MKYCKQCGKEFEDSMQFCTNCGGRLGQNTMGQEATRVNVSAGRPNPKMKFSNIIIVLIAVLAAGYFIYDRIEKKKQADKEQIEANKLMAFAKYDKIGEFGDYGVEGLALVSQKLTDENGKSKVLYGFINERYEECVLCIYQRIEPFEGDVTLVELADKYALINKSGEIEQQLKYTEITDFTEEGYARAFLRDKNKGDQFWFINRRGKELDQKYEWISDPTESSSWYKDVQWMKVKKDGKYGMIDKNRQEVIRCKYDDVDNSRYDKLFDDNGLVRVRVGDQWGCINKSGSEIVPIKYDFLYRYKDDVYKVTLNDKWGYIDKKGNTVIDCVYDDDFKLPEGNNGVIIKRNGLYGMRNYYGEYVSPQYEFISSHIYYDRILVKKNGKYGFIKAWGGDEIIRCIYDYASDFSYNRSYVQKDGQTFYIDVNGNRLN